MFIDFMCYVSITVVYSYGYYQAMLIPIDATKFCYSLVDYFILLVTNTDQTPYLFLPLCAYTKTERNNRTPEHILNDTVSKTIFCCIYVFLNYLFTYYMSFTEIQ